MSQTTYVVGEVYYQLGFARVVEGGAPRLLVSTWRYDGVRKLACNSRECEVPYHFHCFTRVGDESDTFGDDAASARRLHIASLAQARLSKLQWREFLQYLNELGEDQRGWDDPERNGAGG